MTGSGTDGRNGALGGTALSAAQTSQEQGGAIRVPASEVRVYATQNVPFKYMVMGGVTIDAAGNCDEAMSIFGEKAASTGANAVTGAPLTKPPPTSNAPDL